jgi:hypothetical protein
MIPLNFLIAILAEVVTVRIPDQPEPVVAEAILRRRYVTIMRTQSIAHRVLVLDQQGEQNEASETIEIHPLVHEILRRIFLRTIRKDRLNEQLTVMMHVIHGWVANLRKRDEYFALDQLVAHANSILTVIEGLSADESVSAEQAEIFRYTRLILQLELSTCLMSKGDYLLSTNLARTALQDLVTVRRNTVTLALTLKAVSSIVIDLNEAGTTAAVMRPFASYAQTVLLQCEAAGPKVAAVGFEYAYGIRSALKARGEFREDPAIATVIDALDSLISRDNSNEMRPNAVMDELQEHISAGELDLVDPLVESLRKTCNSHDAVTLDCLEVDIALRRDEFDSALPALDCLLTLELHKTHRAHPLSRGLAKIYWTLEKLIAEGRGPTDDLRTMSVRARVRAEDLHEQIVAEVDGNTATS